MSNLTFKAPIDIYVNCKFKETVTRKVIHRLGVPYARYEKQWRELEGKIIDDTTMYLCIFIEKEER